MTGSEFNRVFEQSAFYKMLGSEGMKELRRRVIDVVVEDIRDGLQNSNQYIICPEDLAEYFYNDIKEEIFEEVKDEYKAKVYEIVSKKFDVGCVGCELDGKCKGSCASINNLEQIATAVNKWAEEHPAKTYIQDFKEKFPTADEFTIRMYCVKDIYGKSRAPESCASASCLQCWSREM